MRRAVARATHAQAPPETTPESRLPLIGSSTIFEGHSAARSTRALASGTPPLTCLLYMTSDQPIATRERLLEAAAYVFSARGYELATVREITSRAGANQAAINYHFGGKSALYAETINRALACTFLPLDVSASTMSPSPQTRAALLHALVDDIVGGTLRNEIPSTHLRLLAVELLRPTGAMRVVIHDALAARAQSLGHSLAQLRAPHDSDDSAQLLAHWLLGSCLVALQLAPQSSYGTSERALAEQTALASRLTRLVADGISGQAA